MGALPDSRELWDVFWTHRATLLGFAHTHPGRGIPGPSHTDLTTFAAVEAGLGKRLHWWIASSDHVVLLRWSAGIYGGLTVPKSAVPWVDRLRELSGYSDEPPRTFHVSESGKVLGVAKAPPPGFDVNRLPKNLQGTIKTAGVWGPNAIAEAWRLHREDPLRPLPPEELERVRPLPEEEIEAALEQGRRDAERERG